MITSKYIFCARSRTFFHPIFWISCVLFCSPGLRSQSVEASNSPFPEYVLHVPGAWEKSGHPELTDRDGFVWYRKFIKVPESWNGRRLFFSVGRIDDIDEAFFNGEKIGANGSMPPLLSDPASFLRRPYLVEPDMIRFGDWNLISVRVYDKGGEGGILEGPVQLAGSDDALDLSGPWLAYVGDSSALAHWPSTYGSPGNKLAVESFFRKTGIDMTNSQPPIVPADKEGRRRAINEAIALFDNNSNVHSNIDGKGPPLSPESTLDQFTVYEGLNIDVALSEPECVQPLFVDFDERGRMWVTQYVQYPDPAGIELVTWDRHLRAVYDRDPPPPPFNTPDKARFRGRDRITIHEDTDGDGHFDLHKTFLDGLNIATSTAFDEDGVWVLNPPYLLFVPDKDKDDIPDGDPVVHLSGFGLEDTHSVANSLKWGPDGWLYGVTGSTVTARIRTHFNPDFQPLKFFGQTVWRYHPAEYRFELFAEGGWNNFGLEFDDQGRAFSGTNGGMQAVHFLQGAFYQKNFGKHGPHNNPHAYTYLNGMKLNGDTRRMVHQWIIYGGGAIPDYEGLMVGVNPLANLVMALKREPVGSSFETFEIHKTIDTNHKWFRPVHIATGPDGAIYISDFYDARITHLDPRDNWDRDHGRIYRLTSDHHKSHPVTNLGTLPSKELLAQLQHPNRWNRETARRLIAGRMEPNLKSALIEQLRNDSDELSALEALWVLFRSDQLDELMVSDALESRFPSVRMWTVRLMADGEVPVRLSQDHLDSLTDLTRTEVNPEVLAQLACSLQRLSPTQSNQLLTVLMDRPEREILSDPAMRNLLWWAVEKSYSLSPDQFMDKFINSRWFNHSPIFQSTITENFARRLVSDPTPSGLRHCGEFLLATEGMAFLESASRGIDLGLRGQFLDAVPDEMVQALANLTSASSSNPNILQLGLRFDRDTFYPPALEFIQNSQSESALRIRIIRTLSENPSSDLADALASLIENVAHPVDVRIEAISAIQSVPQPDQGHRLINILRDSNSSHPDKLELALLSALTAYQPWASQLLSALIDQNLDQNLIPQEFQILLTHSSDPKVKSSALNLWPHLLESTSTNQNILEDKVRNILLSQSGQASMENGRTLFSNLCGNCHKLHQTGASIAPDLTGYERDNLDYLITSIIYPSIAVREEYELSNVTLAGPDEFSPGITYSGFIQSENQSAVQLKDLAGVIHDIPVRNILSRSRSRTSIMPQGLLNSLSDNEIRDLFSWLQSTPP